MLRSALNNPLLVPCAPNDAGGKPVGISASRKLRVPARPRGPTPGGCVQDDDASICVPEDRSLFLWAQACGEQLRTHDREVAAPANMCSPGKSSPTRHQVKKQPSTARVTPAASRIDPIAVWRSRWPPASISGKQDERILNSDGKLRQ